MKLFSWVRGYTPLFAAFALVACGGGSTTTADSASAVGTSTGTPAPVPASPPMSMPTSSTPSASVLAPSLAGADAVASGLDVSADLQPINSIPGLDALGVEGAFRFLCAPSHNAYDDPIVYPGQVGKSHLHTFFGNTGADANSTYKSLRTSGDSTCNNELNRSAYWVAAMMHPSGKVVMPYQIGIYYKRPPQGSIYCAPPYAKACLALPRGLRYIFGYNMSDPTKSSPKETRWFICLKTDGNHDGGYPTIKEAAAGCPIGASLGMLLLGPNCWNGTELDSPDHRSHMAYQSFDGAHTQAVCPATHPYLLPFFEAGAFYVNDGTVAQWKLSSDIQMGTDGGVTAHADWYGAWEDSVKDMWTANCIDKSLSCSGGDLGNGQVLTAKSGYKGNATTIALVDAPKKP